MKFLSVCSGIEAASVAWEPLGWRASGFAEIEPFPCAVLAHHYPDVPNHGDMTLLPAKIRAGEVEAPDLLCGGTPCQAFSVAGLRQSFNDARGNLTLTFCEIADAIDAMRKRPSIVFWENVPGVLNTKDNAFGCFLGALAGEDDALIAPGGRWANAGFVDGSQRAVAWRVLDAQYFGVAQRRRRVFVVASARADFDPAAVLFEFEGVRRDTAPSREAGKAAAGTVTTRSGSSSAGGIGTDEACGGYLQPVLSHDPVPCLETTSHDYNRADGFTMVAQSAAPTLTASNDPSRSPQSTEITNQVAAVHAASMAVRRLTPVECERLQGFPDNYTNIKDKCPDGPRYKALGNSWAVPVVRWIGERIERSLG